MIKFFIFLIIFILYYNVTFSNASITDLISSMSFETSKKINDITNNEQGSPSMAIDKNGNIYLTWSDLRSGGTDFDIYFSKSTDKGLAFTENIRINDVTIGSQNTSKIVVDRNGIIHVVWSDARNDAGDIYFSKSTNGGNTFSESKKVNDSPQGQGTQTYPCIVLDGNRNIYVSWIDNRNGTNMYDVYFSKSEDGGSVFKSNIKLGQISTNLSSTPTRGITMAVGLNKNMNGYIIYVGFEVVTSGMSDIYLTRSIDNGTTFSTPVIINDVTIDDQSSPKIDVNGRGDLYVMWQDKRNATDYDIYLAKSTDNGVIFEKSIVVNDIKTSDQGNFTITGATNIWSNLTFIVDGEGNVFAAWNDKRSGDFDIYYTKSIIKYTKTNLDNIVAYPNPLNYSTSNSKTVSFVGLTDDSIVRIYNVAGELVRELNTILNGKCIWDIKNNSGDLIASGVYIFIVTNSENDRKIGKIAIIK